MHVHHLQYLEPGTLGGIEILVRHNRVLWLFWTNIESQSRSSIVSRRSSIEVLWWLVTIWDRRRQSRTADLGSSL